MTWKHPTRLMTVCLLALWSCGLGPVQPPADPADADLSILFIGNSLTFSNDLPGMLERMLEEHGDLGDVLVESVSSPNFGLEDHWNGLSVARDRIGAGGWDWVIMQQGPSATEGRPSLLEYTLRFAQEIESVGARAALYMVWPARDRAFDFDGVLDSYRTAAEQIEGAFFPAGEAWRAAWARDPSLALYGPDGFHPSVRGSYAAAVVMYEQISRRDPLTLPSSIPVAAGTLAIPPSDAETIHLAAKETNAAFAR